MHQTHRTAVNTVQHGSERVGWRPPLFSGWRAPLFSDWRAPLFSGWPLPLFTQQYAWQGGNTLLLLMACSAVTVLCWKGFDMESQKTDKDE